MEEMLPSEFTTNILCLSFTPLNYSLYYLKDNENTPKIQPFKLYNFAFLSQNFSIHENPKILGYCHGFVSLTQAATPSPQNPHVFFPFLNPISVFNPITQEFTTLPHFTIPGEKFSKCFTGFGYEFWKKEFKMALITFTARNYASQIFDSEVQICTLGSNSWRKRVGIVPKILLGGDSNGNGCLGEYLNGCLHWFVSDESVKNDESVIVSFNLCLEEFGFISLPELHKVPYGFSRRFGVIEECLSVVECCRDFLMNVWVMQKYNVKESWVKRFTIVLRDPFYSSRLGFKAVNVVKVRQNGELVLLCDDKYMASYNIKRKEWRVIEVQGLESKAKDCVGRIEAHPFVGFSIFLNSACAAWSIEKLAPELISNILSRLPFKSTAVCKCVSKPWRTILSDPTFLYVQLTHYSKIDSDILAIPVEAWTGGSTVFYLEESAITETPSKPLKNLDYRFLQQLMVYLDPKILGSCHGFVCVAQGTNTPIPQGGCRMFTDVHFPFLSPTSVFNPLTKEFSRLPAFKIPDCEICQKEDGKFFYKCFPGLGFEDSERELRMVLVMFSVRNYKSQIFDNEVQICAVGSKTWRRKIGIAPDVLIQANDASAGAFLNGRLHWIAAQKKNLLIVFFDLGVEEFGFVSTPPLQKVKGYCTRFGVLDGCLSVVECCGEYCIDIWSMERYSVKESWVKRLCVLLDPLRTNNLSFNVVEVLKIRKNGEVVLLCDSKYMVYYDISSKECRLLEVQGYEGRGKSYNCNLLAIPLAGTLIPLKSVSTKGNFN